MNFNEVNEVAQLKAETKLIARKRKKTSKLDVHRYQLCKLFHAGATKAELQRWLIKKKGMRVHWTTLNRWLDKNA
ncbi:hypothetical protein ACD631_12150 [Alteromonas macleodii]|uniref:hypothetical protein n=1 Tax=Alteromonas macleodii TaxID=28108 RepID=UPI002076B38D|nr:hypothetical protein [Alteromonas macleodii]USI27128.1 hypothetical protein NFG60_15605 [Alteromonas macleodii]